MNGDSRPEGRPSPTTTTTDSSTSQSGGHGSPGAATPIPSNGTSSSATRAPVRQNGVISGPGAGKWAQGAYALVTTALAAHTGYTAPAGQNWRCPGPYHANGDRNPSLSVNQGQKGVLLHCFAGCSAEDIARALELKLTDLMDEPPTPARNGSGSQEKPVEYDYEDKAGELVYQVVRRPPKRFSQRRPDGHGGWEWNLDGVDPIPYRLPDVLKALDEGRTPVFVVEGEKDVDTAWRHGLVATCNSGGAGKWTDSHTEWLAGAREVVVVADNDEPGMAHARVVRESLDAILGDEEGKGAPVRVVKAAAGKDLTDHLVTHGLGVDDLVPVDLVASLPAGEPAGDSKLWTPPTELVVPAKPHFEFVKLWKVEMEHRPWSFEGWFVAGKYHLLVGREGDGKGFTGARFSADFSRGELPGIYYGQPVLVAYASVEDESNIDSGPRLMAAGADPDYLAVLQCGKAGLRFPRDFEELTENLRPGSGKDCAGAKVLIIDHIKSMFSERIDEKDAAVVTLKIVGPLREMAAELGLTIIQIHHLNRSDTEVALDRLSGSLGYQQGARTVSVLGKHPDNPARLVLARSKGNAGKVPSARVLEWVEPKDPTSPEPYLREAHLRWVTEETELTADDLMVTSATKRRERQERSEQPSRVQRCADLISVHPRMEDRGWALASEMREYLSKHGFTNGKVLTLARDAAGVTTAHSGPIAGGLSVWVRDSLVYSKDNPPWGHLLPTVLGSPATVPGSPETPREPDKADKVEEGGPARSVGPPPPVCLDPRTHGPTDPRDPSEILPADIAKCPLPVKDEMGTGASEQGFDF